MTSPAEVTDRQPRSREVSRVIDADPQTVYDAVADMVRTAAYSDEITTMTWIVRSRPEQVTEGDVFEAANEMMGMQWRSRSLVVTARPGQAFHFVVGTTAKPTATWSYDLKARGDSTLVRYRVLLGDGPSMFERISGGDPERRAQVETSRLDGFADGMATGLDTLATELSS